MTVRLVRNYEFVAEFNDVAGRPSLVFDEPPPLGEGRAPNAAAVLGAAVGNCLAASLAFCMRKVRLGVHGVTANVTTHVTRNEKGRFRISGIDVELAPDLGDQPIGLPNAAEGQISSGTLERGKFERCEELFKDFCTVTASVRHGVPINVSLKQPAAAGA